MNAWVSSYDFDINLSFLDNEEDRFVLDQMQKEFMKYAKEEMAHEIIDVKKAVYLLHAVQKIREAFEESAKKKAEKKEAANE